MKTIFRIGRLIFYLTLYLSFILIPLEIIEAKSLCFTYSHFHLICPACGITRAFSALMHGKFLLAYYYNEVFTLAIFPISTLIFLQDIVLIIYCLITKKTRKSIIEWLLGT